MPIAKKGGRKNRKYGRLLRRPAFKRYWSSFSVAGIQYQHRLEYKKVKALVDSGQFDTMKKALLWWRDNRKRNNKR